MMRIPRCARNDKASPLPVSRFPPPASRHSGFGKIVLATNFFPHVRPGGRLELHHALAVVGRNGRSLGACGRWSHASDLDAVLSPPPGSGVVLRPARAVWCRPCRQIPDRDTRHADQLGTALGAVDPVSLVRAAALYVPLSLTAVAWLARAPSRRERAAAILATAWNVPALLALHVAARRFGWWSYGVTDATIAGFPIDLYLGWAVACRRPRNARAATSSGRAASDIARASSP